ncbi:hypothetical protein FRC16_001796 [Serendipita sp. 398]|nr:hypothetical protein FRC16_001796 [Serendipita sp. 398]
MLRMEKEKPSIQLVVRHGSRLLMVQRERLIRSSSLSEEDARVEWDGRDSFGGYHRDVDESLPTSRIEDVDRDCIALICKIYNRTRRRRIGRGSRGFRIRSPPSVLLEVAMECRLRMV